ncbi:unnamed protein product [Porites evermanni]|uniref:Uncharacterized protein n=1 Tax=Porites evermanni TaxID=104178 RepID=A0ABN8RRU7_9CNID|nr:unnamed protein product [Porites evermanni]
MELIQQLDILADTLFIEASLLGRYKSFRTITLGKNRKAYADGFCSVINCDHDKPLGEVAIYGVRNVKIYAREIIAAETSKIAFITPDWEQEFPPIGLESNGDGSNGENGNSGEAGPQVDVICEKIKGNLIVSSQGGNGHKGQDGVGGRKGSNTPDKVDNIKPWPRCTYGSYWVIGDATSEDHTKAFEKCSRQNINPEKGNRGGDGGRGGNAGTPGRGGNSGRITVQYKQLLGGLKVKACGGRGAEPAENGEGGNGGKGGAGVRGLICLTSRQSGEDYWLCSEHSRPSASVGDTGSKGASGTTPKSRGQDGEVSESHVHKSETIGAQSAADFPEELLLVIRRQAVELLLTYTNERKGRDALQFIVDVTTGREDVKYIKHDAERKLAFVGKIGYDIFGNNALFTPLVKWETLQNYVNGIKDAAEIYENAFNDVLQQVTDNENFEQIATIMSDSASAQVNAQKRRLIAARAIDESEKRMYVQAILEADRQMNYTLQRILKSIREAQAAESAKLSKQQMVAVLQGVTGFSSAIFTSKTSEEPQGPFAYIETALVIIDYDTNKQCRVALDSVVKSAEKWLTFGQYRPLEDSSDLNFDLIDVSSVTDIMQANLEINKEEFAADLVCLLEEAKVMDLDNSIGGHNFDIPLLHQTEMAISEFSQPEEATISNQLRQTFLENLLGTYEELEQSFMENVYQLQKALGFSTLWVLDDVMRSFQRIASESAFGTGRLNGVLELTKVLQQLSDITFKAEKCFSRLRYSKGVQKWSFDNETDTQMFEEIKNGSTRFSIGEDQICETCHNARMIKVFIHY